VVKLTHSSKNDSIMNKLILILLLSLGFISTTFAGEIAGY